MPVEELAKLVKHGSDGMFFYNLPRVEPERYHRCVRITLRENPEPELHFELQADMRVVASVTHKLDDIFNLLPRLSAAMPRLLAFLNEQAE